nr:hypothetical protein [Sneathiella glossodoripedis]
MNQVAKIHETALDIFKRSDKENRPTHEIADQMALERVEAARAKRINVDRLTG